MVDSETQELRGGGGGFAGGWTTREWGKERASWKMELTNRLAKTVEAEDLTPVFGGVRGRVGACTMMSLGSRLSKISHQRGDAAEKTKCRGRGVCLARESAKRDSMRERFSLTRTKSASQELARTSLVGGDACSSAPFLLRFAPFLLRFALGSILFAVGSTLFALYLFPLPPPMPARPDCAARSLGRRR